MTRGGGRIFKRKGSGFWWVSFYVRGKEVRQSTGVEHWDGTQANGKKKTSAKKQALNFLKQKSDEKSADRMGLKTFVGPEQRRIKISELLDALAKDFALRQKDSPQLQSHLRSVHVYFGACRAVEVTSEMVDAYIEERLSAGAMPASVNRNTQILGQAFKLAIRRKHLSSGPSIRRLSEKGNVRQGFFSNTEIRAVIENLADYLGDLTLFGYLSGWRRGEIVSLEWPDIDGDVIRLRPENSKNGEGRMLVLEGELAELIERRRVARRIETADSPTLAALVFHHAGHKIGNFRKAWARACRMAGVPGKLFHDLRRSAVRDMIRSGVPERIAMSLSGHKTQSMLYRYCIINEEDQRAALRRTQEFRASDQDRVVAMPSARVQ